MLKNRRIEMRLVKSKKDEVPSNDPLLKSEDVASMVTFADMMGKRVVKGLAVYFALSAARQIAVSRLGK